MPSEEDGEHLGALLECVPLDTVRFAFAYGSGAIAQYGSQTEDKMVDFIIASSNSHTFHEENLDRNPSHYSMIRRLGARSITNMQRNFAARVFYNTLIRYKGRLLKYGVVECDDLQRDLLDWRWLYLAGRLHKPIMHIVPPTEAIASALRENRTSAVQAALLLLPDTFNLEQFFSQIVSLSYHGDFRMFFGEDKKKIEKIVKGSSQHLHDIYVPILESDSRTLVRGFRVEQDLGTASIYHRMQLLPCTVLERLQRAANRRDAKQRDIEEVTFSLAHRLDASHQLADAIQSIVAPAALQQTIKNALSAGFVRSTIYSCNKIAKMFKSLPFMR
uniref:Phosphatidate cytidylyltransferase, mitochondrial n=2 Tax=Ascaris TaxID=6251 RepID=A0A0M3HNP5_ASCLU